MPALTTFYVDNTAPCPGSGTQASPWCDFSAVDYTIFQPGDQILLKRGDTFTTGMLLEGSGTSTNYLTVSAYGSGAMPIINVAGLASELDVAALGIGRVPAIESGNRPREVRKRG